MYIKELQIENFGPFKEQTIQFKERGLNIIFGTNAAGKTQILSAIYAAIFSNNILKYHDNSILGGKTKLTILNDDSAIFINQVHTNKKSYLIAESFDEIKLLSTLERSNIYFYFPMFERHRNRKYLKQDIKNAFEFLENIGVEGHHILGICNAKTDMNILMSVGEERYLNLICFLMNIPKNSIVIGDGLLSFYDSQLCNLVIEMLTKIQGVQFILAETDHTFNILKEQNISAHRLTPNSNQLSPVSYNYKEIPRHQSKLSKQNMVSGAESQTIVPTPYRIGDKFHNGESKEIEFKEVKGKNPCNSIIDTAEIYINAYLNSRIKDVGRILWGIDDNKIICGVKLTYEDIDTIQKRISEAASHAHPMVDPELYTIEFHQTISAQGQLAQDTYVVEIDVYPHESDYFYSTSKDDVYVKTPGGKQKIDAFDLQRLFIERMGKELTT